MLEVLYYIFVILGIISIIWLPISIFAIRNILRKYNDAEEIAEFSDKWIKDFHQTIELLNSRLVQIDHRGSFKSDDEVGIFFDELKKIQQILNEQFATEEKTNDR